jgi:D-tyrosyl-tRNA(Tyr) deacylase
MRKVIGQIGKGLVVFLGVGRADTEKDVIYLSKKITELRIFPDQDKLMNKSLLDVSGEMLIVSQFTLYADCRKGRRPSFNQAAPPETARDLYVKFTQEIQKRGIQVATGQFQAMMEVSLVNDGPVTITLDSENRPKG